MFMNFVDKYFPENINALVGLGETVNKIVEFLDNFRKEKKKALLLVGPEGGGKTCSVYAIAKTKGYEVVEVNASDKRNAENVRTIIGSASKQATLLGKPKIILIDEVDGLHGNSDRGGVKEINNIVKNTSFPIIMTANNAYNAKIKSIKANVKVVNVKRRSYWSIYNLLKFVAAKEAINLSAQSLKKLASMAQGDVRSALNDLQNLESDEEVVELYERQKRVNIFEVLKIIFKSRNIDSLIKALDDFSDLELKDVLLWVAENIIVEYEKPHEIREAYDWISRADVFMGRINKRMHWRLMYYAKLLFTIGVGLSKDDMYRKFSRFQVPVKIGKMVKSVKSRNELKTLAAEIGSLTHCSRSKALVEYAPYYKLWLNA